MYYWWKKENADECACDIKKNSKTIKIVVIDIYHLLS